MKIQEKFPNEESLQHTTPSSKLTIGQLKGRSFTVNSSNSNIPFPRQKQQISPNSNTHEMSGHLIKLPSIEPTNTPAAAQYPFFLRKANLSDIQFLNEKLTSEPDTASVIFEGVERKLGDLTLQELESTEKVFVLPNTTEEAERQEEKLSTLLFNSLEEAEEFYAKYPVMMKDGEPQKYHIAIIPEELHEEFHEILYPALEKYLKYREERELTKSPNDSNIETESTINLTRSGSGTYISTYTYHSPSVKNKRKETENESVFVFINFPTQRLFDRILAAEKIVEDIKEQKRQEREEEKKEQIKKKELNREIRTEEYKRADSQQNALQHEAVQGEINERGKSPQAL